MEASKIFNRSLRLISTRAKTCQYQFSSLQRPDTLSLRQHASTGKPFSTSANRRHPLPATQSTTSSPSTPPPISSPKVELESYARTVQKIIDGYNLKSRLPPPQYESLVVAVTNAEVRLNAPGAHPDSFAPLLKSLHGEIEPILKMNLGSSNVAQLIADVGKQMNTPALQITPTEAPTEAHQPRQSPPGKITQTLDTLFGNPKPSPTKSQPIPTPSEDDEPSTRTLLTDLYAHYDQKDRNERSQTSDPSNPSSPSGTTLAETARRSANLSMQKRVLPDSLALGDRNYLRNNPNSSDALPALRLKPTLGRTVQVSGTFDVTRALRNLEGLCSRNSVRTDFNKQRFHVRRGQMKKTLRRIRWRKLFAEGFIEECARVRRMRRQGW